MTLMSVVAIVACSTDGSSIAARAGAPAPGSVVEQAVAAAGGSLADPVIGVGYRITLYTHCGVREAIIGSRHWVAVPPPPASQGMLYTSGTVTFLAADRFRFDSSEAPSVEFVPAQTSLPPCL